jgi:hypothetical protein
VPGDEHGKTTTSEPEPGSQGEIKPWRNSLPENDRPKSQISISRPAGGLGVSGGSVSCQQRLPPDADAPPRQAAPFAGRLILQGLIMQEGFKLLV